MNFRIPNRKRMVIEHNPMSGLELKKSIKFLFDGWGEVEVFCQGTGYDAETLRRYTKKDQIPQELAMLTRMLVAFRHIGAPLPLEFYPFHDKTINQFKHDIRNPEPEVKIPEPVEDDHSHMIDDEDPIDFDKLFNNRGVRVFPGLKKFEF